jgi:hypothetical protein
MRVDCGFSLLALVGWISNRGRYPLGDVRGVFGLQHLSEPMKVNDSSGDGRKIDN